MKTIKQYIQSKKEVLKKPSFWINQIIDVAIVILIFGWIMGYIPFMYMISGIGLYIGVHIFFTVKKSIHTAIEEVNKQKSKRR